MTKEVKRGWINLLCRAVIAAVVGIVVFTQVFFFDQVNGNHMFPAVKDGDLLMGFRLQKNWSRNDVCVYKIDGTEYVGRIIAKEGDVVDINDSGTVAVNGTVESGEIFSPTYPYEDLTYPIRVPEGEVFLLGDYRTEAVDSRTLGTIPAKSIKGKVITLMRRRGL